MTKLPLQPKIMPCNSSFMNYIPENQQLNFNFCWKHCKINSTSSSHPWGIFPCNFCSGKNKERCPEGKILGKVSTYCSSFNFLLGEGFPHFLAQWFEAFCNTGALFHISTFWGSSRLISVPLHKENFPVKLLIRKIKKSCGIWTLNYIPCVDQWIKSNMHRN